MDKEDKKLIIFFCIGVVIIFLIFFLIFSIFYGEHRFNVACQEIGFEDFFFSNAFSYCEDSEGNLHYVKLDCSFPPFTDCTVKEISVGDVRVK